MHEEQQKAGHIPLLMSTIQPARLWQESGRYDAYGDEMLRIQDRQGKQLLFGPTNEEQITDVFRTHVKSYRELPLTLYHIQWKFRDEIRPRFGVMRGREFYMKDGYNFDIDYESAMNSYHRHMVSYLRTYERMGLTAFPMRAESGPIGGDNTHEFLILAETGESLVYYDTQVMNLRLGNKTVDYANDRANLEYANEWTQYYARTEETHDKAEFAKIPIERQGQSRAIEVGQIFYFGTKYSEKMGAYVTDSQGKKTAVHMGSHGIGVSRLVGAIIEASHDDKGIIWPQSVSPFDAALINLKTNESSCDAACEALYQQMVNAGIDGLYDDRNESPGVKMSAFELIGLPWAIVVGPKGLKNNEVEILCRKSGHRQGVTLDQAVEKLKHSISEHQIK